MDKPVFRTFSRFFVPFTYESFAEQAEQLPTEPRKRSNSREIVLPEYQWALELLKMKKRVKHQRLLIQENDAKLKIARDNILKLKDLRTVMKRASRQKSFSIMRAHAKKITPRRRAQSIPVNQCRPSMTPKPNNSSLFLTSPDAEFRYYPALVSERKHNVTPKSPAGRPLMRLRLNRYKPTLPL